jgi:glucose-1-phosphatase
MATIKNLLFDLGNVILDLDTSRTQVALEALLRTSGAVDTRQSAWLNTFTEYETGRLSDELFINSIIQYAHPHVYAQQVIRAWNAMLIDIPPERLDYLEWLRAQGYRLFLLSNTNGLHLEWLGKYLRKNHQVSSLDRWFEKSYYSHIIRQRKPDASCFQYVMQDAGILPAETLFIDDLYENIQGAQSIGIHTLYLTGGQEMIHSIKSYLRGE